MIIFKLNVHKILISIKKHIALLLSFIFILLMLFYKIKLLLTNICGIIIKNYCQYRNLFSS